MKKLVRELIDNSKESSVKAQNNLVTLGLLIEKHTIEEPNDNDYKVLMAQCYYDLKLSEIEIKEILENLILLIKEGVPYADSAVWALGKSCQEDYIKKVFRIILEKKDIVFNGKLIRQTLYVLDGMSRKLIKEFETELRELQNNLEDDELKTVINNMLNKSFLK